MSELHWPVIGHEWAVEHLDRAIRHGRMRHLPSDHRRQPDRQTTLARALAMVLKLHRDAPPCGSAGLHAIAKNKHPDIAWGGRSEGGTLKIDQVRALQQTLALRPYEGRSRVAICGFHEANPRRPTRC